jgi:shikimate kinase
VQRIFAEAGEAAFRKLEAEALRETGEQEPIVVAVGGGALTIEDNLHWALANGVVIYLYVSLDDLIGRLLHGRTVRPLLLDDSGEVMPETDLREKVADMMARREPFYRQAHLTVETGNLRVGHAVDAVAHAVRRYRR